jgi:protein SCO1/2
MVDHDGQPFTLASQRGKVVLIFFGYTFCPDACPTTLSKLASVYRRLGKGASRVKTLYISVDPERDTPAVLKADLENFKIDAIGLTGTKAQIDAVVAQYGAMYEIVPTPESAAKYTVSHTTTLYGLDPDGRLRIRWRYDATADEIIEGVRTLLNASARTDSESSTIEEGRTMYAENGCANCHGRNGHGDGPVGRTLTPPPRDFRDAAAFKRGTDETSIASTLTQGLGSPGSAMPAFGHLRERERRSLAEFIISLRSPAR